jgi:hypothetical protein
MQHNLQHAIERHAARLAEQKTTGENRWPIPPSVGGVGLSADALKKPVAAEIPEKAKLTTTGSIG